MAESRIRHAKRYDCLTAGDDYEIIVRSVKLGCADLEEALSEATFIVRSCWPDVVKLAVHLQTHPHLTFAQISTLLDLMNCRPVYDESKGPIRGSADDTAPQHIELLSARIAHAASRRRRADRAR